MKSNHKPLKIINVVGARPNFMKIAPIIEEMKKFPEEINPILVHTGQHYDEQMSKFFFQDLGLSKPDIHLGVGSGSQAEQTAKIMVEFEKVLIKQKPDLVVVVGDVNSTIACALAAAKLQIKVAHVEAGLRSFDLAMPEEINRRMTDSISDYLFITESSAKENLLKEGKSEDKIFFVGNVMIDTLLKNKQKAAGSNILKQLELCPGKYVLVTLHRPSNVDNLNQLKNIYQALCEISTKMPVVFPVHPRTRKNLSLLNAQYSAADSIKIKLIEPLGYLDFLKLMSEAKVVLTDSGGIQEETTVLKVPCLTLRENTERPVTLKQGSNKLVGLDMSLLLKEFNQIIANDCLSISIPELWDGKAAQRIVKILIEKKACL